MTLDCSVCFLSGDFGCADCVSPCSSSFGVRGWHAVRDGTPDLVLRTASTVTLQLRRTQRWERHHKKTELADKTEHRRTTPTDSNPTTHPSQSPDTATFRSWDEPAHTAAPNTTPPQHPSRQRQHGHHQRHRCSRRVTQNTLPAPSEWRHWRTQIQSSAYWHLINQPSLEIMAGRCAQRGAPPLAQYTHAAENRTSQALLHFVTDLAKTLTDHAKSSRQIFVKFKHFDTL